MIGSHHRGEAARSSRSLHPTFGLVGLTSVTAKACSDDDVIIGIAMEAQVGEDNYSMLELYVAKIETPSENDRDWELQGRFGSFPEAVLQAADIERMSSTPVIIMDIGSFRLNGKYRYDQPLVCWWSENYVDAMERASPTERGTGWHHNHGFVEYEYVEKPEAPQPTLGAAVRQNLQPRAVSSERAASNIAVPFDPSRIRYRRPLSSRIAASMLWLLWALFLVPGRAILWYEYMYPAKGQVYASGRRLKSDVAAVFASIGLYISLLFTMVIIIMVINHYRR